MALPLSCFFICNKTTSDKNDHVASLSHVLDSNYGTHFLPKWRGSHMCTWVNGPRLIVTMGAMVVANFVEIPLSAIMGCDKIKNNSFICTVYFIQKLFQLGQNLYKTSTNKCSHNGNAYDVLTILWKSHWLQGKNSVCKRNEKF